MRPTAHEAVMERVDEQGQVLGFSIIGVSRFQKDKAFPHPKTPHHPSPGLCSTRAIVKISKFRLIAL
jgi:hypothetical protein